ncbi:MAG: hypothetical protein MUC95_02650 [Spirochaetes bacterium]|nr:hypothetical protein [Spirochaetota bacterium]
MFIFFLSIITVFFACSAHEIKDKKDGMGRTVRKAILKNNIVEFQVDTKYLEKTNSPLIKVYRKVIDGTPVAWWTELYTYENDRVSEVKFLVNINSEKIPSGKISYQYESDRLKMAEYFSIFDKNSQVLNRHGFDLYYYSNGAIVNRRIIEYEYNRQTGDSIQISQYVIQYDNNGIQSMETKMLDRKINEMITKNETNTGFINEMIANIEKSLRDRCIGINLIKQ